jgi:hypothetical protein
MAESKSSFFRILINGHSEKSREFDSNSIRRLADISECKTRWTRSIINQGQPMANAEEQ